MGFYETQEANYEYRKSMRKSYDEGYEAGYKQGKADALEIRPVLRRGKWIRDFSNYYCSECRKFAHIDYNKWDVFSPGAWILSNFCPNCGADMRGEADG